MTPVYAPLWTGTHHAPGPAHYARQAAAMRALRDSRMPDGLTATCRDVTRAGFGNLLETGGTARSAAIGLASSGGI